MIPRRALDIRWSHLLYALARCASVRISALAPPDDTLPVLSVRSGLDALLHSLALPAGSEVLMSAITVRDMASIIEAHGLKPIALEVEPRSLSVSPSEIEQRVTPRTRVLMVAHLFGSRMPMEPLAQLATQHDLVLIEDCAQVFCGDGYTGHARTNAALFSFGPIKTATALGGGLLFVRDAELRRRIADVQQSWPVQSTMTYAMRCAKYALLKLLSKRVPYGVLCALCRMLSSPHDVLIRKLTRNFAPHELLPQIRQRPCAALVNLMLKRWQETPQSVARRVTAVQLLDGSLHAATRPGAHCNEHTHWVAPLLCSDPQALARTLLEHGFDASRGSSSMAVIGNAPESAAWYKQVLYLPAHEECKPCDMRRLASVLATMASNDQL
jgi:perosamine synthetase